MEALLARAWLARVPGLGAPQLRALLSAAGGDPVGALKARSARDTELPAAARQALACPDEATSAADVAWCQAHGVHLLLAGDAHYPALLEQCAGAPAALYVQGTIEALKSPQLAMLGTRHPSAEGRSTAHQFAAWFARSGLTVTSGLAPGIDAASHEGALAGGGLTVAVCGTSLDQVYPPEHAGLAARIRAHGALVSEWPPHTAPQREHFRARNRLISGLAIGTLVVEAARGSSPLYAARLAAEQGREVFAIPGSIHSPLSRGTHQLIREGAKLVEEAADVFGELRNYFVKETLTPDTMTAAAAPPLDKEYEMLLDALGFEPATVDVLVARTHLAGKSVASMLLRLELEGRVAALPGGRYGRIP
jgi:DNA processing protein